jgi:hypothetical protein
MSKYALINKNNKVINIIELNSIGEWPIPKDCKIIKSETAIIDSTYVNGDFIIPEENENINEQSIDEQIKSLESLITPRMIREAMLNSTDIGLGENKDLTSNQYIIQINTKINALRKKL